MPGWFGCLPPEGAMLLLKDRLMLPSGDLPEHTEAFPDTTSHNTASPFCDYDDDYHDDDDADADDDADDEVHAGLFWLSTTVC